VKVAVTIVAAETVTAQVPVPMHPPPDQPVKSESLAADALSMTMTPELNIELHVAPQFTPAGDEVTVPLPVPAFATVTANELIANVAVADLAWSMVTMHVGIVPVQAPPQPVNELVAEAPAVRVTIAPWLNVPEQVDPQSIPVGDDVIVPVPVPALLTLSA
jgi:hypothetical protein